MRRLTSIFLLSNNVINVNTYIIYKQLRTMKNFINQSDLSDRIIAARKAIRSVSKRLRQKRGDRN